MRLPTSPETKAAILLLGLAALNALVGAVGGGAQVLHTAAAPAALPPVGSAQRKDMDWCLRNVGIIHDVYWASACASQPADDAADCTLPEPRASQLNAARAKAEQQCVDEAAGR